MEMSDIDNQKAVQNAPIPKESDVDTFQVLTRPILEHYTQKQKVCVSYMLRDRLRPTLLTTSREMLTRVDALLQDDACPHTAVQTVDTLRQTNFDMLTHLPYSLIWHLRIISCLVHYKTLSEDATNQELKEVMHAWLVSQPKVF
jgi:hypothetical protein